MDCYLLDTAVSILQHHPSALVRYHGYCGELQAIRTAFSEIGIEVLISSGPSTMRDRVRTYEIRRTHEPSSQKQPVLPLWEQLHGELDFSGGVVSVRSEPLHWWWPPDWIAWLARELGQVERRHI